MQQNQNKEKEHVNHRERCKFLRIHGKHQKMYDFEETFIIKEIKLNFEVPDIPIIKGKSMNEY